MIGAIFAGGVRAAKLRRIDKTPSNMDTFCYICMTLVITFLFAGLIVHLELPINDNTIFFWGAMFVFVGQYTDIIYLKAGERISELIETYKK